MDNNVFFFKIPNKPIFDLVGCALCGIMVFLCVVYKSKSAQNLRRAESGFFLYIIYIKRSHNSNMSLHLKPSKSSFEVLKMTSTRFFSVPNCAKQVFKSLNVSKYPKISKNIHEPLYGKILTFQFNSKNLS